MGSNPSKNGILKRKKEEPYEEEPIPVGSDGYLGTAPNTPRDPPVEEPVTYTIHLSRPPTRNSIVGNEVGDLSTAKAINKGSNNKNGQMVENVEVKKNSADEVLDAMSIRIEYVLNMEEYESPTFEDLEKPELIL